AWTHPADRRAEAAAKRALLHWRVHSLLGDLTGDSAHYHEAVLARPDLAPARSALGCSLALAGKFELAVPHLRAATSANPLDAGASRALYQALVDSGQDEEAAALARARRLVCRAAPG